jgi:hypothetical protein
MPARSAGAGTVLDRYRQLLERMDEAACAVSQPDASGPCGECRACCGPLSLLPLEACALLASGLLDDRPPSAAACPLLDATGCRARSARPFACRARGLPVRHLDAEGLWSTSACELIAGHDRARDAAVPLAKWAAMLFGLDREYRGSLGARVGRIDLADLCRAPASYRELLSVPAVLPLASRAAR